ncbi:MAG: DUF3800 domain-containing protein [Thermoleophilia bacterium]|nr:DUF3800 domain-containing protein [Thermoleophilia bacterium]
MDINVYCDEAYPDLFSSNRPQAKYLLIGSLWLKSADQQMYKTEIHELRDQYKIGGEFKWGKASPSKIDFYKALISWYIAKGEDLRFRCIAVDRQKVNLVQYHESDQELGFYKFYYQMIHHWLHDFNSYRIFCDFKQNRQPDRLHTLQRCLSSSNLSSTVETVQAVRSDESVLIQSNDVLLGLASARINNRLNENSAKEEIVGHMEDLLHREIRPTPLHEKKFNLFKIDLQGGW